MFLSIHLPGQDLTSSQILTNMRTKTSIVMLTDPGNLSLWHAL